MTNATEKPKKQMPKGGRKGGAKFPRYDLATAVAWAKKAVSKTHLGPQARDIIMSGVVGAKSGMGNVRISALRQYGLLDGDASGYRASDLARQINVAPSEELKPLYQKAILQTSIFKTLFETYHGDDVTKAKLKQRAADLNVHPEEIETCVDIYVSGMITAGLVSEEGDKVKHVSSAEVFNGAQDKADAPVSETVSLELGDTEACEEVEDNIEDTNHEDGTNKIEQRAPGPRAVFNVNVTLDSSLDIEKLEKQLQLLKRFGAI